MKSGVAQGWLLAVLVTGGVLAFAGLGRAGGAAMTTGGKPFLPPLLSTGQLAGVAGGFRPALADVYWIRAISTSDTVLDGAGGAERAYALVDRVTALDPRFEPAYHYGALMIGIRAQRPDLADRLLARAEQGTAGNWRFPFYRGFLRLYHMHNLAEAAGYLERAAAIAGSPPYLSALAQRLREQQDDPRMAIELIDRMLQAVDDPETIKRMRARRDALIARLQERSAL